MILNNVMLYDNNGNHITYSQNDQVLQNCSKVQITNNNTEDKEAPVLHDLSISPVQIKASETTTLTLKVSDDVSGVDYAHVSFTNNLTGYEIEASWTSYDSQPVNDGEIEVQVETSKYDGAGSYQLDYVELADQNGFREVWYSSNNPYQFDPYSPKKSPLIL